MKHSAQQQEEALFGILVYIVKWRISITNAGVRWVHRLDDGGLKTDEFWLALKLD